MFTFLREGLKRKSFLGLFWPEKIAAKSPVPEFTEVHAQSKNTGVLNLVFFV
jgi:hypothetical protein